MKILKLTILILVNLYYSVSISQNCKHNKCVCGAVKYMQEQFIENPNYKMELDKLEVETQEYLKHNSIIKSEDPVYVIPVVFHIVYNSSSDNVPDSRIKKQIDVLNEDFRLRSKDTTNIPDIFKHLAADTKIEFVLANRDPNGNITTGINRVKTNVETWYWPVDQVKHSYNGGADNWDPRYYLNIWVCNFELGNTEDGFTLAYATFPGGKAVYDGIVIQPFRIGVSGNSKGRTLTHEIGHWLNLYHTWGDDQNLGNKCLRDDNVEDTPKQEIMNFGVPEFPHPSCDNVSDMFMNHMDYVDDEMKLMFTHGQAARMRSAIKLRRSEIINSMGYILSVTEKEQLEDYVSIYPNPVADGNLTIKLSIDIENMKITLRNILGNIVYSTETISNKEVKINTSDTPNGIYFVEVSTNTTKIIKKIIISNKY